MTKQEFINTLKKHASNATIFGGRFICISEDENHWTYHRPAVDALEPSIDLSNEGFVMFYQNISFNDNGIQKISYDDFVTKYNLNRE